MIGALLDLRHLRYFLAVAEEGHFGRAAARLNIVQPALSMQIRALEEELGGALFIRTSRRVELTVAGALFQVEAQRTIMQAEHAKSNVQKYMRGEIGRVRVGFAGNALFTGRLLQDLRNFRRGYPGVELELCEMSPSLQSEAILDGRLDVGYLPGQGASHDAQLTVEALCKWPWVVAMAADHPLTKVQRLTTRLLESESFIIYASHGLDDGQLSVLRAVLGCEPKVAHRVPTTLSVLALAAAGLGITLVPETLRMVAVPNLVYKSIANYRFTADLVLLSRKDEPAGAVQRYLAMSRAAPGVETSASLAAG
jgi:DNA-binding transcriptional LysR family regulator